MKARNTDGTETSWSETSNELYTYAAMPTNVIARGRNEIDGYYVDVTWDEGDSNNPAENFNVTSIGNGFKTHNATYRRPTIVTFKL